MTCRTGRLLVVVAMALSGCGGDPGNSRLSVGQKVMVVPYKRSDQDKADPYVYLSDPSDRSGLPQLPAGTHLTVVADDGEHEWHSRDVLVHVEDGEHRGISGKLVRWNLHPE